MCFYVRRCPTLPGVYTPSTIGAGELNFRVRNGNGWVPAAIATGQISFSTGYQLLRISRAFGVKANLNSEDNSMPLSYR